MTKRAGFTLPKVPSAARAVLKNVPREDGFTQPRSYVEVDSIDDTVAVAREVVEKALTDVSGGHAIRHCTSLGLGT